MKNFMKRECIKVGIASGKDWRHVVKEQRGFQGYDLRIQRTFHGSLYEVFCIEQMLHKKFEFDRFKPSHKFGGHTECFKIDSKILDEFPKWSETITTDKESFLAHRRKQEELHWKKKGNVSGLLNSIHNTQ